MNWWIISILAFIVIVLFKANEIKHRIGLLAITFLLIFLALSVYQVYTTNTLNLTNFDGIVGAGKIYFNWLGSLFHNAKKVSVFAIQQDWGVNVSNLTEP